MRNLKRVCEVVSKAGSDPECEITAVCWDPATGSAICAFGPTESNPIIDLKRVSSSDRDLSAVSPLASWDAPSPLPDLPYDRVLSIHYFADTATICIVLAGGDLVVVREDPLPGEEKIEIVGSVDVGITAAVWSPDEELLAISTRADTFLYMTRDYENSTSMSFSPEDLKASRHVDVGWGKRETQFQGKRAKALRDPTMPEKTDEGKLSPADHGETTVSWRGDGAFVAVNKIEGGSARRIRVYSRDGMLDSVSEPVDGLEGTLSWRPSGQLIAGVRRSGDSESAEVVFFERNGLRHGQFQLRLSQEELKTFGSSIQLHWNGDSTVLGVVLRDRVQLWTVGNYHYYLKQEIRTGSRDATSPSLKLAWHPERTLRLLLASKGKTLLALTPISKVTKLMSNRMSSLARLCFRRVEWTHDVRE